MKHTIKGVVDEYKHSGYQGKLLADLTYTPYEEDTPITVSFSNDAVISALENYYSFESLMPKANNSDLTEFVSKLSVYRLFNEKRIERIADALLIKYSPIENVDEKTTNTTVHSGEDKTEVENAQRVSTTENVATNKPTDLGYVSTFDSAEPVLMSKATNEGGTTNKVEGFTDKSKLTHGHQEKLTIRRRGNIGVTANYQLISGELLEARCWNLLDVIIADFIGAKYFYHTNYEGV